MDKTEHVQRVKSTIKLSEINYTPVLIAFIAILVTFGMHSWPVEQIHAEQKTNIMRSISVILFLWKRKSFVKSDILLTGLCESGKTVLFGQILHSKVAETFTSIAENIGDYKSDNAVARLVDIPGHERLRLRFFDQYKSTSKGIVYVVDSVTVQKDIRDVAE